MFRLTLAGPDTHVLSSLCAACPYAAAGCCVAPPRYSWSDIARVVVHGETEWLVAQVALGHLVPFEHGLSLLRRVEPGSSEAKKCVFHEDGKGCSIRPEQRPATCNYYVCDRALEDGAKLGYARDVAKTQDVLEHLVARFVAWDETLAERVRPEGSDGAWLTLGPEKANLEKARARLADLACGFEQLRRAVHKT
jgi:hypothetical protein